MLWGFADGNNSSVLDIDVNDTNGQIIIGAVPSTFTGQTLRLCDASGTTLNNTSYGRITVNSVKFDALGNIFFSGHFQDIGNDFDWSPNTFDMSAPFSIQAVGFVGKYDSLANFEWAVQYDPTNSINYRASFYNITIDADNNPIIAYGESNGSALNKGFFKISASNGAAIWPNSMFGVAVGLRGADVIPSPIDGTVVFSAGAGFSGNAITTVDAAPDPNVTNNITGRGYWNFLAKYGNCVGAPATPDTISGSLSLCNADSMEYTVPLQTGVGSYNWTLPFGWSGISNSNSITVLPSANGGLLEVAASNLCGASAASNLTVSYIGSPSVIANANLSQVCLGDSVQLTGTGADSYVWNNNVSNGLAFAPLSTSNYIVVGTLNGCNNSDTITVTVNPIPPVGLNLAAVDTLCQDAGVVTLIGESPLGGVFSGTGVTSNTFDALTSGMGNYPIVYTYIDANSCTNFAVDSIYVDVCTGIDDGISNTNWIIYPNPSAGEVNVFVNDLNNEIWVTDMLGKIVFQKTIYQKSINLNLSKSGVYIVHLKNRNSVSQKKLIVK